MASKLAHYTPAGSEISDRRTEVSFHSPTSDLRFLTSVFAVNVFARVLTAETQSTPRRCRGKSLFRLNAFERDRGGVHCPLPKREREKNLVCRAEALLESISNPAARQIVGRHFYTDAVTHQNAYAVLAHLAGNSCQHDVRAVIEFDFKECVGLLVDYGALRGNQIISGQ
ncbi:MAG: hypothetical protein QOG23_3440 [Blastocatellia bacterium]|nr:hypothetical protein [Blastocatellia bacterium]